MRSLRAFVIGLGRIGLTLEGDRHRASPCTHAHAYSRHDNFDLVGGFDTDINAVRYFRQQFPGVFASSRGLLRALEKQKPQVVSVAATSSSHLKIMEVLAQFQAHHGGLLGILLEKPVGLNLVEANIIQELCERMKVEVVVCHDRRFYSEFAYFKKIIDSRRFGLLRHVRTEVHCGSYAEGRARTGPNLNFGGPLLHDGTHALDLMLYFAGPVRIAGGICSRSHARIRTEDTVNAHLIFQNGVQGSLLVGGRRKYFSFSLELGFERARIFHSQGMMLCLHKPKDSYLLMPIDLRFPKAKNPYMVRLDVLLESIISPHKNPSTLDDGIQALSVIELIYESARNGGIMLPLSANEAMAEDIMAEQHYWQGFRF